ncbi:MAG TPA: EamA family transporter [Actinomycetes bacterium]|nr:EamA family transporter [Actinomycetes bacterium]
MSRASLLRLCALAVLWGSGFLFVKLALRGLSPSQVVLGQLALGALVLLITLVVRRQSLPHAGREWVYLAGMAVLANIAPYLLFSWSEQRISSGLAGVLSGTTPLLTLLLARAFGLGQLTPPRVLGLALGLAGVVLLAAPWHDGSQAVSLAGVLAALGAAACYAGSYVYARLLLTNRGIEPLMLAAAQLTLGAVLLGSAVPWIGPQPMTLSSSVVLSVVALGVLSTGIAYVLNYRLIQDEGPTAASMTNYLTPVVAVLLGIAVVGERLTWNVIIGTAMILVGLWIADHSPTDREVANDTMKLSEAEGRTR